MSAQLVPPAVSSWVADRQRHLRVRSEHTLRVIAMKQLARRYPDKAVRSKIANDGLLWRLGFAPLYRRVSWQFKRDAMFKLKMTAQGWAQDARQFQQPWQPPRQPERTPGKH